MNSTHTFSQRWKKPPRTDVNSNSEFSSLIIHHCVLSYIKLSASLSIFLCLSHFLTLTHAHTRCRWQFRLFRRIHQLCFRSTYFILYHKIYEAFCLPFERYQSFECSWCVGVWEFHRRQRRWRHRIVHSKTHFHRTNKNRNARSTNDYGDGDAMESKMTTLMLFCVIFVLVVCLFMPSKNMDMRQHQHIGDKNGENQMKRCDMNGMAYGRRQRHDMAADTMFRDLTATSCIGLMCVDSHEKQTFKMLTAAHTHSHTHTRAEQWNGKSFDLKIVLAELMRCLHHSRWFFVLGKCRHGN